MEALSDRVRANYDFSEEVAFGFSLNPPK